jgi:PAS domain S-box-containing protein
VETAVDAIISIDSDGNIILWNHSAESMFGYRAHNVMGKPLAFIMPERYREAHREALQRVLSTGKSNIIGKTAELAGVRRTGVEFPLELSLAKWGSGDAVFFTAVIRDITERKRLDQDLRDRTHRLGERVKELNCLYAVSALLNRPDVSLEEILRGAVDLIPAAWQYPQVTAARIVLGAQVFETCNWKESAWTQTSDIIVRGRPAGTVEVYYLEERPECDEGPFLKEERSLIRAIAELLAEAVEGKRVEEERARLLALADQERQRLQTLVDTSPVGIILADADGRLLLVNREAERILGAPVRVGDSIEHYNRAAVRRRPDGSEYGPGELPVERALNHGESTLAEEIHFHHDDGRIVPVLMDAVPLYGARGEITGAIAVQQDITPLEELDKLRHEFLGMVSHELKTPLTAIKGSAATALGSSMPLGTAQTRELFQIIDEQADRLRGLVDNLLDVSLIEAGALSIEAETADLREIIQEAHAGFMRESRMHEVRLELPDTLPAVSADRHRICQVVMNLLSNADKFSPPMTPITVSAEVEPLWVTVHVRDEGRGIAEEDLSRLFRKFSRPHERSGFKLPGSGLGLAICKGVVEAHGGRIWAESSGEGRGATISFSLPVAAPEIAPARPETERGVSGTDRISRRRERRRVLAVDDEAHVLRYLQHTLEEAGYEPVVTSDPSQVTKLLETSEPDLVLLDLRLPGTSGFEVLERIRELSEAPVIFLTASDREDDAVKALRMGADDYITKPFSPSELLARADAVLRRRAEVSAGETRRPFVLGDLKIDFAGRQVTLAGEPVSLSPTEYKLLCELAVHAGRVLTYDQILQRAWGPEYSGETDLVRAFVRNLRRKLGDDARNPRFILTERGVGYRMPPAES